MKFDLLVNTIQDTHTSLQEQAIKSINRNLTIRNWLIGFYIVEFEQKGEDRAKYGEKLLQNLAVALSKDSLSFRNLKLFRQFYLTYPQIGQSASAQFKNWGISSASIGQTPSAQLQVIDNHDPVIMQISSAQLSTTKNQIRKIWESIIAQYETYPKNSLQIPSEKLISKLSFSHLSLLLPVKDPLKRTFYEIECIKGTWSVSELKRQINSLYFERSGMSKMPERLSEIVQESASAMQVADIIKSPFTFEFLGLKAKDVVYENDLEQALIDHLEEFLIELGHGFCFEAKQKRIIIGDKYYFIDLVFYHRILKCHVLIELKTEEVKHEHIGQLKTYINFYKKEIMLPGDNPPVGLLMVTHNDKALVEYAMADSDQPLFVNRYALELPSKQELEDFINRELRQF